MIRRRIVALVLVSATVPALASEGHGHGHGGAAARTVTISMGDMSFSPDRLTVKRGETIRFLLRNDSAVDHDFTVGDAATQAAHRRDMAAGHAHGGHAADNAVMVPAGGRGELSWTFDRSGPVEFDCNVPGHFEAGMQGQIVVEE